MILKVVIYPDEFLKKKSLPVKKIGPVEKKLFSDMLYTMKANKGVGLAAVQVGVLKQLVMVDVGKGNLIKLANPKIIGHKGLVDCDEGCLSVPGETITVERFNEIVVKGLNEQNKEMTLLLHGMEAIAMQHEIDHLEGKTIMDYKK